MEKNKNNRRKYNQNSTDVINSEKDNLLTDENVLLQKNQTTINFNVKDSKNLASFGVYAILIALIFMIFALSTFVGGAWFFKRQSVKDRDLSFGSIEILTHNLPQSETYESQQHISYSVAFENVGTLEAVVRAISCVEWDNGSPMEETLEIGQDWTLKDDGYYYYNKILKSGETTSVFLSGVTFNNNKKQGAYKIPIYVESAQVKNGVYKELFDVGDEYE